MLPSVLRNVNVLIEAGGFYSRKYGILTPDMVLMPILWGNCCHRKIG